MASVQEGIITTNTVNGKTYNLRWTISGQYPDSNETVIQYSIYPPKSSAPYIEYKLSIDGQTSSGSSYGEYQSFYATIPHNIDGTKTFSISLQIAVNQEGKFDAVANGVFELPPIQREVIASCGPAIIGHDHSIIVSNPSKIPVTLKYRISYQDGSEIKTISQIVVERTTNFNIIGVPSDDFYNAIPATEKNVIATLVCEAYSGTTLVSATSSSFILSIDEIVAAPDINGTVTDTNPISIALTGDSSKLVRYISTARVQVNSQGKKGAKIVENRITYNNATFTGSSHSFPEIQNNIFVIGTTDSRGLISEKNLRPLIINYIPLTCKVVADVSARGAVSLSVYGDYFDGSFGAKSNALTIEYRFKQENEAFSQWSSITPNVSNGQYSGMLSIEGLDYHKLYTFEVKVNDLAKTLTQIQTIKFTPVFDWGKNDFEFNVPVKFNAGVIGDLGASSGVFSPSAISGAVNDNFTVANGAWFRAGNIVTVTFHIEGTGNNEPIAIGNLPFQVDGEYGSGGNCTFTGMYYESAIPFLGLQAKSENSSIVGWWGISPTSSSLGSGERPLKTKSGSHFIIDGTITYVTS